MKVFLLIDIAFESHCETCPKSSLYLYALTSGNCYRSQVLQAILKVNSTSACFLFHVCGKLGFKAITDTAGQVGRNPAGLL